MKNKIRIAFIGCGNMARAIITSMTDPGTVSALKRNGKVFRITAADRDEAKLMPIKHLCDVTTNNAAAVDSGDYVVLAVKPQDAEQALLGLALRDKTVISIMAGVSISALKTMTGSDRIVRVMPNLCAGVGESYSAYTYIGDVDSQTLQEILGSFGVFVKTDEKLFDGVTGVAGSGPAFVFCMLKALFDEAVAQGFDGDAAKAIAVQTVIGSALYAEKSDNDFDGLIASVCSVGGTTERGIEHLNANGFDRILRGAIRKSVERSKEMAL